MADERRGLNDPLLVTSDGAPGIVKAIEICFPRADRQRCLAHRMRNLAAKVPEDVWPDFKVRAQAAYQAPSRAIARELAAGVVADYGRKYDSAVACFMDDGEESEINVGRKGVGNAPEGAGAFYVRRTGRFLTLVPASNEPWIDAGMNRVNLMKAD
jgi:Transposase, Mutator family